MTPTPSRFFHEYGRQNSDLKSINLVLSESGQAKVKIMGKSIECLGACLQEFFLKSLSLERQKMPLCVVGKFVYIIDLHSVMENMILSSNLCCTILKNSKL